MSSKKDRKKLIAEIEQMARDNGNLNVLIVSAIAQHVGLSATEFECCGLITEQGPFTAGELAERCHITTGGMTGMIDRMERAGFVRRDTDDNDRRRVLVSAIDNKKAKRTVCHLFQPLEAAFNKAMSEYTTEQLETLAHFFNTCNAMFRSALEGLPDKRTPGKH